MSGDYEPIEEADEVNRENEEYRDEKLEDADKYGVSLNRYEGTLSTSTGEEVEDAVDVMLGNWNRNKQ